MSACCLVKIARRYVLVPTDDRDAAGDGPPRVAAPNLIDDGHTHAIGGGKLYGGDADSVINCKGLRVGQEGYRVDFGLAECSVALAVEDVQLAKIRYSVVIFRFNRKIDSVID